MLPLSLEEATVRMMGPDSIAREDSVFGNDFVDHYGGTREHEVRLWNAAVTNWEGNVFFATLANALTDLSQLNDTWSWHEKSRYVLLITQ